MVKESDKDKDLEPDEEFQEFHSPDAYSFEDDEVKDEILGESDLDSYPEEFNLELEQAAKEVAEEEKKKKEESISSTVGVKLGDKKPKVKKKPAKKKAVKPKIKKKPVKEVPKVEEFKEPEKISEEKEKPKKIEIFSGKNIAIAASIIFIVLVMVFVVINAVSNSYDAAENSPAVQDEIKDNLEKDNPVDSEISDLLLDKLEKNKK